MRKYIIEYKISKHTAADSFTIHQHNNSKYYVDFQIWHHSDPVLSPSSSMARCIVESSFNTSKIALNSIKIGVCLMNYYFISFYLFFLEIIAARSFKRSLCECMSFSIKLENERRVKYRELSSTRSPLFSPQNMNVKSCRKDGTLQTAHLQILVVERRSHQALLQTAVADALYFTFAVLYTARRCDACVWQRNYLNCHRWTNEYLQSAKIKAKSWQCLYR